MEHNIWMGVDEINEILPVFKTKIMKEAYRSFS
jgi:hypothetical protein